MFQTHLGKKLSNKNKALMCVTYVCLVMYDNDSL